MVITLRYGLLTSAAIVLVCSSVQALAQDKPASTASADTGNVAETGDIIVTANKRNESINKVGASIVAFDSTMLANRNIVNAEELAASIPGMKLAPSTHGTPVFTLRGVGFNADALGVYPAVSVSVDQAPLTFPVLAGHTMYDIERVEVLKGPQGTLFGQNSTGGAINYIVAKPTEELRAGFNLDYGRFNEVHGTAYISGPISDTLGIRFAVDAAHRDAWQYNFTRPDKNGEQNYVAARLVTVWKPTDRLRLELNVNGSVDRSEPQALQIVTSIPSNPAAPTFEELNATLAPRKLRAANWSNDGRPGNALQSPTDAARPSGNRKLFQAFLRADLELTDDIALTSISTFNRLKQNMSFDLDGTQYELVDNPTDDGTITDLSQELRLSNASTPGALFRWTAGANYNHSKVNEYQNITYGDNSLSNAGTNFIHTSGVDNRGRINTWSVFANGEYDVTDQITLKGAVRYTKSVNKNSMCNSDPAADRLISTLFTQLGTILGGRTVNAQCYTLYPDNVPGGPFLFKLSEDNVSWRAGIDFKATSSTLLYANISRGYKAGSFPVITATLTAQLIPAKQESVTSYEAGFKTKLAGNMVQLSGAAFYQDYRDKQIQGTVATGLFGLLQRLDNLPKSHIIGAEADIVVRPASGLTLTGSASYLKTKVDTYSGTTVFGAQRNFAGDRLPFAPSWTLVGDIDYRIPTGSGGAVFLGAGVNYRTSIDAYVGGDSLAVPDNGVNRSTERFPFKIAGYALVDARLGYEFPGDKATISIWGKNVFNKFNVQNVISYNDIITRATGMPATYGISLKVKWN